MKIIANVVTIKATPCGLQAKTWRAEIVKIGDEPRITLWQNGQLWGEFARRDVDHAMDYACSRSRKPHVLRALLRGMETLQ